MRRVLFADGQDDRVLAAVVELGRRDVRPVVFDDPQRTLATATRLGLSLEGIEVLDTLPERAAVATKIAAQRGVEPWLVDRLLDRPIYGALAMLATGAVDALVAGATSHTSDVLVACEMCLGFRAGSTTPSSTFVMDIPGLSRLVFADCAVNPEPTFEQLAEIAIAAADTAPVVLGEPARVAMLSFSTHGSAHHPAVDKIAKATALVRERRPDIVIDGELQADAALDPASAARKLDDGAVAGNANVLVFPDLGAGNIGYKLVRSLAKAKAYGALLHGYTKPVVKLSRGATTDEIIGSAKALVALAR